MIPPQSPNQALANAIVRRAHEFTLPALLDALAALGLRAEELEFRSHRSQAHQAFLIHSVELRDNPSRAIVRLNIGLLAGQSPLPSYFFALLDDGEHDTDALLYFLALFDHPLLKARARAEYPERDRQCVADWEHDQGLVLRLMALQSPSSLHWLFQRVYPELGVAVGRLVQQRTLATEQVIMGSSALGESRALGGKVSLATGGVAVTLYCDAPTSPAGRPWAQEAARRFDTHILPLLREQNFFLDIWLVILDGSPTAHLVADPRAPDGFLGYEPLGGSASPTAAQRVLLYSDYTDPK